MRVLVIRFSSIGDVVLTIPVLRCLRMQKPSAQIHYLIKKQFAPLLSACPYVDRIVEFEGSLLELVRKLRKEKYDFIADLHGSLRSWLVRQALAGTPSAVYPKHLLERALLVHLKAGWVVLPHVVDRYFEAVAPLGIKNDRAGLEYFIPEEERVDPLRWSLSPGEYVCVVVGAAHATKEIPVETLAQALNTVALPAVLIGGRADRQRAEILCRELCVPVVNLCGELTLNNSASLIEQAGVVVGGDTGMIHIAVALGKPVVQVWGSTVPELGMYPYMAGRWLPVRMLEVKWLGCRPCSHLGKKKCPKGHFLCMRAISSNEIASAIKWALRQGKEILKN